MWSDNQIKELESKNAKAPIQLIIDRVTNESSNENQSRILDSLELAFHEGKGNCEIVTFKGNQSSATNFNNLFKKDDIIFEQPSLDFFSFNNPYGACTIWIIK